MMWSFKVPHYGCTRGGYYNGYYCTAPVPDCCPVPCVVEPSLLLLGAVLAASALFPEAVAAIFVASG